MISNNSIHIISTQLSTQSKSIKKWTEIFCCLQWFIHIINSIGKTKSHKWKKKLIQIWRTNCNHLIEITFIIHRFMRLMWCKSSIVSFTQMIWKIFARCLRWIYSFVCSLVLLMTWTILETTTFSKPSAKANWLCYTMTMLFWKIIIPRACSSCLTIFLPIAISSKALLLKIMRSVGKTLLTILWALTCQNMEHHRMSWRKSAKL